MSEEIEEFEEVEGIDLEEIGKRYEEKGIFRRLIDMFSGLGKPHNSREYKLARIEMQRLMAPLAAVVSVVLFVVILIVVTAVTGQAKKKIEITVATIEEQDAEIEETAEEEPPEEPPEPPPIEEVDIVIDTPLPGPPSPMAPAPSTPQAQVSTKPAAADTVAFVNSPVKMKSMVGSRTPGSIGAATRGGANYGDAQTEAAVMKALRWLKKTQRQDGSWDKGNNNSASSPVAATGLALLTLLAHGETPASEEFGTTVEKAINYLITNQVQLKGREGDMVWSYSDAERGGTGCYPFPIATYALCEAYGMTKNPDVKEAAERALARLVAKQSPTGGWNYYFARDANLPSIGAHGAADDLSLGGWAIQALKAGKLAGIHIEGLDECIKKAIHCLKTRNFDKKLGFAYRGNGAERNTQGHGLGGVGCLAMQLLGYGKESEVKNALNVMDSWVPTFEHEVHPHPGSYWNSPQYYYYYAAQCKFQAGMAKGASKQDQDRWKKWNAEMKAYYPKQIKDGGEIDGPGGKKVKCGYWENKDVAGHSIRPVMDTCLAALQLMVYYRYLPAATLKASDEKTKTASEAASGSNDVDVSVEI
ncbi:MAG: hypothetical protein IKO43_01385 [Kiritimatiellae bacterium]|nr:hypothetical protein [Kiritimatiellia bacterium]